MSQDEPFYLRLREEREQHHLTQQELADLVKADISTIRRWESRQRWESGRIGPSAYFSRKLEEVFGKHLDEFGKGRLVESNNHASQPHENANPPDPYAVETISQKQHFQEELREAPYRIQFHGRHQELATLQSWMIDDRCQVVAILGVGGVGKSTLAASVVEQCKPHFTKILWRSLYNPPQFDYTLNYCIQFFSQQAYSALPDNREDQITLLIHYLQQERCLLILDNVESVIQPGKHVGQYRSGYEGYGRLFQRLGEARHQSCLLLTGREKPSEVALLEGKHSPVRSFSLDGLELAPSRNILGERELFGQNEDWAALVSLYRGNPLALKLIADPIEDVFSGDIARFLRESESVFGSITHLLDEQFQRLSEQEQEILYWLAIEREAVSINDIHQDIAHPLSRRELVDAFSSLRRRSLVERGSSDTFLLQPVILEYITTLLVQQFIDAFSVAPSTTWHQYALLKAQAKDYIKTSQVLLITAPIAQALHTAMKAEDIERVLLDRLAQLRQDNLSSQSYYPGNVLNLLIYLHRDLRGKDFSALPIRQANLQNALLPEVDFSHAFFRDVSFTSTFGNVQSVTFSSHGDLVATGTASGEIWIYDASSHNPLYIYRGHTDAVWSVVFNQDNTLLASCGDDRAIRLWDRTSGQCLNVLRGHTDRVRSLAFHPHGRLLASASEDKRVCLWDIHTGKVVSTFYGHENRVWSVAFSPDGKMLASASTDRTVRLWDVENGTNLKVLQGHKDWVRAIAFSPQGDVLASCGDDKNIILWNTATGALLKTLQGHTGRAWAVAFDASGQRLSSGSEDHSIRIWDAINGTCTFTLYGHSNGIRSVAFSPDGHTIVSGGDDQTMRFWDVASGHCLRTLYGHTNRIWSALFGKAGQIVLSCHEDRSIRLWDLTTLTCYKTLHHHMHGARAIAIAPHGQTLASGGEDQLVRLWDIQSGRCFKTLAGHISWIRAIAINLQGNLLASGGEDLTIRLWTIPAGDSMVLTGHQGWIRDLAFHPTQNLLASASDDETIKLWDTTTGQFLRDFHGHNGHVRSVCFHPQGNLLASGGEDGTVRLWDISTGTCLHQYANHTSWVRCVCFNADGTYLASSSDDGTIHLYDLDRITNSRVLQGHSARVRCIRFDNDGQNLLSSSDDGTIKLWDAQTGQCLHTLRTERLYERMNITAAQGLTDAQKTLLQALGAFEEDSDQ